VPFRDWLQHLQHAQTPGLFATSPALRLQTILPELVTSALLLLAAFALLRWLYYPAAERPNQEQEQEPEESA
jgi:alpha-beta hydrolase superfamily lysophospholipase